MIQHKLWEIICNKNQCCADFHMYLYISLRSPIMGRESKWNEKEFIIERWEFINNNFDACPIHNTIPACLDHPMCLFGSFSSRLLRYMRIRRAHFTITHATLVEFSRCISRRLKISINQKCLCDRENMRDIFSEIIRKWCKCFFENMAGKDVFFNFRRKSSFEKLSNEISTKTESFFADLTSKKSHTSWTSPW